MGVVRKTATAVIGLALIAFLVIVVFPGLALGLGFIVLSKRTVYERASSQDGGHEARVQFDDAGAISSFYRVVFIKSRWNPSDTPLLSCRAFWTDGEGVIHLHWQNDHVLLIEYSVPDGVEIDPTNHCANIQTVTREVPAP